MFRQLNDAVRYWWTVRRKPLEAFMEPVALAGDALLCRDGSLVSLVRIEGARSITGKKELGEFVELAKRRLNGVFLDRGHGLHIVLERAPDAARAAIDAAAERQRRQCERLGLALGDVIAERSERLAGLLTGETCALACWTRPDVVPGPQVRREKRELKARLKGWLPGIRESQCPLQVVDSLPPRHEAFVSTVTSLLKEAGLMAEELGSHEAVRVMRVLLNGPDAAGPDWRPVGPEDEVWPRFTEPPELGSFPPPLAPQLLVREPQVEASRLRIGGRLYGAVDMVLGPRVERPFSELMSRLADGGIPFRFSLSFEGGGLSGSGPSIALAAASVLAVTSEDSRHVRDALAGLRALRGDEQAIVRLRIGLLSLGRRGRRRAGAGAEAGADAADLRGLGRVRVLSAGGRRARGLCGVGARVRDGGHGRAGAGAARECARHAAALSAGVCGAAGPSGLSLQERGRQAARLQPGGERRLRVRPGLRHSGPGQERAAGLAVAGLLPAGWTPAPAFAGGGRYRAVLVGADLDDPRGAAGGPALRGWLVRAADDARACDQPLRYAVGLPVPAAAGAGVPDEPVVAHPDAGGCGRGAGRRGRDDLADDRRDLQDEGGRQAGGRAASLHARPGRGSRRGSRSSGGCTCLRDRSGGTRWMCSSRLARSMQPAVRSVTRFRRCWIA